VGTFVRAPAAAVARTVDPTNALSDPLLRPLAMDPTVDSADVECDPQDDHESMDPLPLAKV